MDAMNFEVVGSSWSHSRSKESNINLN